MKPRTGFEEPRGELFTEIVETKRLKA